MTREELSAKNSPREYLLDDPAEVRRLMRECRGYLHTCHSKHGTDWEGRKFAIDALDKLSIASDQPRYFTGCLRNGTCRGLCRNTDCPNHDMVVAARMVVEPKQDGIVYPAETT